jgi:hypothetical protein
LFHHDLLNFLLFLLIYDLFHGIKYPALDPLLLIVLHLMQQVVLGELDFQAAPPDINGLQDQQALMLF